MNFIKMPFYCEDINNHRSNKRRIICCAFFLFFVLTGFFSYRYFEGRTLDKATIFYNQFDKEINLCKTDVKSYPSCIKNLIPLVSSIKQEFKRSACAPMSALRIASALYDLNEINEAKKELEWVISKEVGKPFGHLAQLRLATILLEEKNFDLALSKISFSYDSRFSPLFSDKEGDIYYAKGDFFKARLAYMNSFNSMSQMDPYRFVVKFKLDALGGALPSDES